MGDIFRSVLELDQEHINFLAKLTDKTFLEIQQMTEEEQEAFHDDVLMKWVVDGNSRESTLAEDFITMLNTWEVGQTEADYSVELEEMYKELGIDG